MKPLLAWHVARTITFVALVVSVSVSCAHREMGHTTPRLAELDDKVAANSDDPAAWVNRGYVHCLLGRSGAAEADFARALKLKPDDAILYSQIGWAWFNADEPQRALTAWLTAVRLSKGKHYYDDYVLAVGYFATGDRFRAADHYHAATQRDERFGDWVTLQKRTETWTQKEKAAIYGAFDLWRKVYKTE